MSIPLDRLYHYIDNIAKEITDNIIIYRFYPHGSKKLEDLQALNGPCAWLDKTLNISLYCNDQEPLNYELYQNISDSHEFKKIVSLIYMPPDRNLHIHPTIYNNVLLLHSERQSKNLIKYQGSQFIPVYYWSHAIIACDWFRYAEHVQQHKQVKKTFLVYNRAWSGTREYRLKFAEHLVRLGLPNYCQTSINTVDPELGIHYELHKFKNPVWRPNAVLENYFPINTAQSHYSADFDIEDYEATDIEVVLETLFDDPRLHLTEKSLRPIACGQPFILAGTHGSLEYLRSYGFKTFGHIWDERYDQIEDPEERLNRIADLMKQIANWMPDVRERKMAQARAIAEYNKQHFFSQQFFDQVITELKNNLQSAVTHLHKVNRFTPFIDRWEQFITFKEIRDFLENEKPGQNPGIPTINQVTTVLQIAKDLEKRQLAAQQE
jgi:hypothetical protein